jgi:hypothetical protein
LAKFQSYAKSTLNSSEEEPMIDKEQQAADDDVPGIISQIILEEWQAGKSAKEIARKMGLHLATVMRILKRMQRTILENDR